MSKEIVLIFIEKINGADINGIVGLMSKDHVFIDNIGNEYLGKEKMREGWKTYFSWFPDYKIEVTDIFQNKDIFLICGFASGAFQYNKKKDEIGRAHV